MKHLKANESLCCIAVAPISKEIFLSHHINKLGGLLSYTVKKVVDLKGMGAPALAIYFYSILFKSSSDIKLLIWTNLKELYSPSDVLNKKKTSISKSKVKDFIALPNFLVDKIKSLANMRDKTFSYSFLLRQTSLN